MLDEKFSIIPGFVSKPAPLSQAVAMHEPRKRFMKAGDNAEHPHTVRMRAIKDELRLTTTQLVKDLNDYEREHQVQNFHGRTDAGTPSWLPLTSVLMSSYLQGWVLQEPYMALMVKRLENLLVHKKSLGSVAPKGDIRSIMDGWYAALGIDPHDSSSSPTRQLGRVIAPYYKRPVLAAISGVFNLGLMQGDLRVFNITEADGTTHEFVLNPAEPIHVKDGQKIKIGDVIQYSVLMQTQKQDDKIVLTHEPSINHTTFYRWYAQNKMPRSIKTIELVQAAVDEAAKALKKKR